jgi:two-component system NtrC family response regulator
MASTEVLFRRFVDGFAGGATITLGDDLMAAIKARSWPGNVRELRNVAERMVTLRRSNALTAADLPVEDAPGAGPQRSVLRLDPANIQLPDEGVALEELERAVVVYALRRHAGNIAAAARYLRVPRHILVYRIEKFGITRSGT